MTVKAKTVCVLLMTAILLSSCVTANRQKQTAPSDDGTEAGEHDGTTPSTDASGDGTTPSTESSGDGTTPSTESSGGEWTNEAAITRFLTETNRSGRIPPEDHLVPPGTLPEVDRIPKADQSLVGTTVSILFAREQQAIPFHYILDKESGAERLTVVIRTDRIPLLIVFETDLGGASALRDKMMNEIPFDAKIMAFVNISCEEGRSSEIVCHYGETPEENLFQIPDSGEVNGQEFLGIFGADYQGTLLAIMKGAEGSSASPELQGDFQVFRRIYERFFPDRFFPFLKNRESNPAGPEHCGRAGFNQAAESLASAGLSVFLMPSMGTRSAPPREKPPGDAPPPCSDGQLPGIISVFACPPFSCAGF